VVVLFEAAFLGGILVFFLFAVISLVLIVAFFEEATFFEVVDFFSVFARLSDL